MSAFVVDKAHINAMVRSGLAVHYRPFSWYHDGKHHSLTDDNASEVGQMLLEECIRSVSYRYDDSEVTNLPGRSDASYLIPFEFKFSLEPPAPVETLKLTHCYEYQSCEHPEWEASEAHAFCQALEHATISRLPGYDDAPWDWTEWPSKTLRRII